MFKINSCTVKNKRTGEKFNPEKIIAQYLIRIVQSGNLAKIIIIIHPQFILYPKVLNCWYALCKFFIQQIVRLSHLPISIFYYVSLQDLTIFKCSHIGKF